MITDDPNEPQLREHDASGMQKAYLVLSDEELAKGFVRPVRRSYQHVGPVGPVHPLRDLTPEEKDRYAAFGYAKFEAYPESESPATGRLWTRAQLDKIGKGCGTVTTMGQAIAETYARNPQFYGGTFCVGCGDHYPVGPQGEFVWVEDVPTDLRVGT